VDAISGSASTSSASAGPGLTEYHGVVTEQDILDLYLAHRAPAVRLARSIVGVEGEDVVHDVTLYLLEKRDYLRDPPGAAYFFTAVRHAALRRLLYAWSRCVVAMDPETLVIAEEMTSPARGRPTERKVRLPEPVG
jgi:DNA-directed RNA polymerase specialized sigma24 family protein